MSTNYINKITDTAGTTHDIAEGVDTRIFRATCPTAAGTAAKVATLDDATGYTLAAGVRVAVTFTYGNSATTPTLNVNSGGAKNIVVPTSVTALTSGNGTTYNTWGPYETVIFTYSGSYWVNSGSGRSIYNAYARSWSDTKVQVAEVTSGTTYYPIVGTGTTAATRQYDTTGFIYTGINGTTSSEGSAILTLGNNLGGTTANNKTGGLVLKGLGGDYIRLMPRYTTGITSEITLYNSTNGNTYTYLLPANEDAGTEDLEAILIDNQHDQQINGKKRFSSLRCQGSGAPVIYFHPANPVDSTSPFGGCIVWGTDSETKSLTQAIIRQYSYNSSDLTRTSYYEDYRLPITTQDLTANKNYDILTTNPTQYEMGRDNTFSASNKYLDSTSTGSSCDISCTKVGKLVFLNVTAHRAASTSSGSTLLKVTLSSGYRPTQTVYSTSNVYQTSWCLGSITTAGVLTVTAQQATVATDYRFNLMFVYLCA